MNDPDLAHLRRAVELAEIALEAGEEPYGSVLVGADGTVLFEDHNRTSGGDQTRHPEFEIARWAANHVAPEDRAGRHRLHVGRALRDVLGGARVGRARADRDRRVLGAVARLGGGPGRAAGAGRARCPSTRSSRTCPSRARTRSSRSACASCSAASSRSGKASDVSAPVAGRPCMIRRSGPCSSSCSCSCSRRPRGPRRARSRCATARCNGRLQRRVPEGGGARAQARRLRDPHDGTGGSRRC